MTGHAVFHKVHEFVQKAFGSDYMVVPIQEFLSSDLGGIVYDLLVHHMSDSLLHFGCLSVVLIDMLDSCVLMSWVFIHAPQLEQDATRGQLFNLWNPSAYTRVNGKVNLQFLPSPRLRGNERNACHHLP